MRPFFTGTSVQMNLSCCAANSYISRGIGEASITAASNTCRKIIVFSSLILLSVSIPDRDFSDKYTKTFF